VVLSFETWDVHPSDSEKKKTLLKKGASGDSFSAREENILAHLARKAQSKKARGGRCLARTDCRSRGGKTQKGKGRRAGRVGGGGVVEGGREKGKEKSPPTKGARQEREGLLERAERKNLQQRRRNHRVEGRGGLKGEKRNRKAIVLRIEKRGGGRAYT